MHAAVARGTSFGTPDRARGRAGRGDRRPVDAGRAGPPRLLRHRGDDVARSGWPAASPVATGREVRRLLPRSRRLAAGRGRLRAGHVRAARHPRRARRSTAADPSCCPTTTVAAVEAAFAEHGDRDRLPDHRGRRRATWAWSRRSRASTRPSPDLPQAHGALFVSDEVMTGFRVTPAGWCGLDGPVRGLAPRPDDVRQGDGRRLPGRGVRRPRRRDGARSRRTGRSTRPAPCPGTRSPPPPGLATLRLRPTRSTPTSTRSPTTLQAAVAEALAAAGRPARRPVRPAPCSASSSATGAGPRLRRRRSAPGLAAFTRVLPRDARPRASTCRRRRSRRGSSQRATTTRPSTGCSTPCPARPRAAARGDTRQEP